MRDLSLRLMFLVVGMALGYTLAVLIEPSILSGKTEVVTVCEQPEREVAAIPKEPPTDPAVTPQFRDPGVLKSNLDARIYVRWTGVEAATKYRLRVFDENGKEVQNFTTKYKATMLKNLRVDPKRKETPYTVRVAAVDAEGKVLPESEAKLLAMLPLKNIAPPSIKSISAED